MDDLTSVRHPGPGHPRGCRQRHRHHRGCSPGHAGPHRCRHQGRSGIPHQVRRAGGYGSPAGPGDPGRCRVGRRCRERPRPGGLSRLHRGTTLRLAQDRHRETAGDQGTARQPRSPAGQGAEIPRRDRQGAQRLPRQSVPPIPGHRTLPPAGRCAGGIPDRTHELLLTGVAAVLRGRPPHPGR